jgi:hypothetical protein
MRGVVNRRLTVVVLMVGILFPTLLLGAARSAVTGTAARPIAPATGAVTTSHPTFVWQLAPNETSEAVYIARRPETTPEGRFFTENVVETGLFFDTRTTWAPERPLFAGSHWWNVATLNSDTFTSSYSTPSAFTVASEVRLLRVRITRESWIYSPDQLQFDIRWVTNVRQVTLDTVITQRGRRVGRVRRGHETLISRDPDTAAFSWTRPRRVRTGSRLTVQIRVVGGGRSAALRRIVRAP